MRIVISRSAAETAQGERALGGANYNEWRSSAAEWNGIIIVDCAIDVVAQIVINTVRVIAEKLVQCGFHDAAIGENDLNLRFLCHLTLPRCAVSRCLWLDNSCFWRRVNIKSAIK